ncbi:hydantoinase/oxoprolinase family protein [Orenia marismortui]|uniref:Hydantoinase/oxoprolinase-like protein n=1 Tax=Orenia marismortui TaxID=46469 RepID=A0A4R8H240_9FIRM|nr:hydantoinase/oxoprolinase family protein [Orenia marismortui]TDX52383.1 hydantoinase/oxoprolinase-like protein [Orenia marismortui]
MKLGIDIGGTHTDGILIDKQKIIKTSKIVTNHNRLSESILRSCQNLISDLDSQKIDSIVLSTTLATNLISKQSYPKTGLILIPGPGLNPQYYNYSPYTRIVSGAIDHRGREVKGIDQQRVKNIVKDLIKEGVKQIGVCGKFSNRNPKQEVEIKALIEQKYPQIEITLGHQLAGRLNYPRRVATTYLNSIIQKDYKKFIKEIQAGLDEIGLEEEVYILKSDGGTMPLLQSAKVPVETINSGPAASIMGILSLSNLKGTTIGLDIGGTTTDISFFVEGDPLFRPDGIEINEYNTLIRGLFNHSIACGGDSSVKIVDNNINIGPERKGAAACLGGPLPTPTDALVVLGLANIGDHNLARERLEPLAQKLNLSIKEIAEKIIDIFCHKIELKIKELINGFNNQTVYTINELLTSTQLKADNLVIIGGPAQPLAAKIAKKLNLDYQLPKNSKVANAIGAALAKITQKCTLYADTSQGYYYISELGIKEEVGSNFNLEQAQKIVKDKLKRNIDFGALIEISNAQSFNMVRGFNTIGRIIEITAQIKPGLERLVDS